MVALYISSFLLYLIFSLLFSIVLGGPLLALGIGAFPG